MGKKLKKIFLNSNILGGFFQKLLKKHLSLFVSSCIIKWIEMNRSGNLDMKNTYLIGYLPVVAMLLFSLSLSMFTQKMIVSLFKKVSLYNSLLEMFTETEVKLTITLALMLLFFMILATLKVMADTVNQLSLLFFSKDTTGDLLLKTRSSSIIFFIGGLISLISFSSLTGILIIFFVTAIGYFVYFVYKIAPDLSIANLIGMISFQVAIWAFFMTMFALVGLKVYNSLLGSLPL